MTDFLLCKWRLGATWVQLARVVIWEEEEEEEEEEDDEEEEEERGWSTFRIVIDGFSNEAISSLWAEEAQIIRQMAAAGRTFSRGCRQRLIFQRSALLF
jgi:hypothetical protein